MESEATAVAQRLRAGLERVVEGNEGPAFGLLVALLAGGHVLLEGVPGTAKTLLVRVLARLLGADFRRIQFTPDLMPADIVGTTVFDPASGTFSLRHGPDLHQSRAGRRDQSHAAENAVGAARSDGRAASDDRRRDASDRARRSSCARRKIRSSSKAPTRCRKRSSIAFSCARAPAIRAEAQERALHRTHRRRLRRARSRRGGRRGRRERR